MAIDSTAPTIVIGTLRTSGFFDSLMVLGRDPDDARELLTAALDSGFRHFDTAPVYARGFAEEDLGRHVPPDARIWTKVGVDITTPLPQLDYSLEGMTRSLAGSLARLQRDSVQAALVHNPPRGALSTLDLKGFAAHCARTGAAELIGVSVLEPAVSLPVIAPRLPAGSIVLCEADQLDPDDDATLGLLADYRLVVRSIFSGGARIRDVPVDERPDAIAARITEITQQYAPVSVVIGPRTVEQLADYLASVGTTAEQVRA